VNYEITHTTEYKHSDAVSVSHHLLHLHPRELPGQKCVLYQLLVEPAPAVTNKRVDYFGNTVTFLAMQAPYEHLTVQARSKVTLSPSSPPAPSATPPWETVIDEGKLPLDVFEFIFDSALIKPGAELAAYAAPSFSAGRPVLEAVVDLTERIHEDFTFDPKATTVATPLTEVFRTRRGVCQDFAHLEIACLRSMGLAARYVSGYLETVPPPGKPRLVGADASHAWLAVYCPGTGWIDVDPTNNLLPSETHITLAWGRDYSDVSPIRGVILGGGEHSLKVAVDIVGLGEE
jgi:transglutaminase-like putative cysteine protease